MYSRHHKTHRVRIRSLIQDVINCSTFDDMVATYGENYAGEICNVTGRYIQTNLPTTPEKLFILTTGATMYDPIHEHVFGESNLADILGTIEIVTEHVRSESDRRSLKDVVFIKMNDQLNNPNGNVDTIQEIANWIHQRFTNELGRINQPEPAKNFAVTSDPSKVIEIFNLFLAHTDKQAKDQITQSLSPVVQEALYKTARSYLERSEYIAFGEQLQYQGNSNEFVIDNAQPNVFNLSVMRGSSTQRICTISYNNLQYSVEIHH